MMETVICMTDILDHLSISSCTYVYIVCFVRWLAYGATVLSTH